MVGESICEQYAAGVRRNSFYDGWGSASDYMEFYRFVDNPNFEKWQEEILEEMGMSSVR